MNVFTVVDRGITGPTLDYTTFTERLASFPGLPTVQFLIASSVQKLEVIKTEWWKGLGTRLPKASKSYKCVLGNLFFC